MPKLARSFGGFIDLSSVPAKYSTGVGNLDKVITSYMVFNYATQQALSIIGMFRPYLVFGVAIGKATLTEDPGNPAGGTVPKSTVAIGHIFVSSTFCSTSLVKADSITTSGCIYRIFKQGLDGPVLCQNNNC